jgi:hypothetical protein
LRSSSVNGAASECFLFVPIVAGRFDWRTLRACGVKEEKLVLVQNLYQRGRRIVSGHVLSNKH